MRWKSRKYYEIVQVEKTLSKVLIQLNKKKMKKIVESFVSLVGTKDWNEAQKRYPNFSNEKLLADLFLKCNFSPIPAAFSDYCSRAVKYVHVLQTMQMNRIIA